MFDRAMVHFKRSRRSLHRGLAIGRRWRVMKRGTGLKRYVLVVKAGVGSTVKHAVWVAARAALRDASSRSRALRQRRGGRAKGLQVEPCPPKPSLQPLADSDEGLAPGERGTLEVGSGVVLGAVGVGLQFGRWPAWTVLLAVGGYLSWVVIYSEATVQTRRWRSGRRPWPLTVARSKQTASPPADE
jgi:hypothetical protein